jgi:antitoxin HigA-1
MAEKTVRKTARKSLRRHAVRPPTHPGLILRDITLPTVSVDKSRIAAMLGISRSHLYGLLAGHKSLSPTMALRIAQLFGGEAETWMRLQVAHDLWHARQGLDVTSLPSMKDAA